MAFSAVVAGSIASITDFSGRLSHTLENFRSSSHHNFVLDNLIVEINKVSRLLNQLNGFLKDHDGIVTDQAVTFVKLKADLAFVLYWRIVQAFTAKHEPDGFEDCLIGYLENLNRDEKAEVAQLDVPSLLKGLESWEWKSASVERKLEHFSKQLRQVHRNIALIFAVVKIRGEHPKWPLSAVEIKTVRSLYWQTAQLAAKVDLVAISPLLKKQSLAGRRSSTFAFEMGRRSHDSLSSHVRQTSPRSQSRSPRRARGPAPPSPASIRPPVPLINPPFPSSFESMIKTNGLVSREEAMVRGQKLHNSIATIPATLDLPAYEVSDAGKLPLKFGSSSTTNALDMLKPEMGRATEPTSKSDDNTYFIAFIIRNGTHSEVPMSDNLVRQKLTSDQALEKQDWLKTITSLNDGELRILNILTTPRVSYSGRWISSVAHLERIKHSHMRFWTYTKSALLALIRIEPIDGKIESSNAPFVYPNPSTLVNGPASGMPPAIPPRMSSCLGPPPAPIASLCLEPALRRAGSPPPPSQPPTLTRIVNINPNILDEAACRRLLTSYSMFTIRKAAPYAPQAHPQLAQKESSWARCEVVEEAVNSAQMQLQLQKLKKSVIEKKLALDQTLQGQINNLLDNQRAKEFDQNFTWELERIDTRTRWMRVITLVVYLKRTPREGLNPIVMHQNVERNKRLALEGWNRASPQQSQMNGPLPPPPAPAQMPGNFNEGVMSLMREKSLPPHSLGGSRNWSHSGNESLSTTRYTSTDSDDSSSDTSCPTIVSRGMRGCHNEQDEVDEHEESGIVAELLGLWTTEMTAGKEEEPTDSKECTQIVDEAKGDGAGQASQGENLSRAGASLAWEDQAYAKRIVEATRPGERISHRCTGGYSSDSEW